MIARVVSRFGVFLMRMLAVLPLAWIRALGTVLGLALYALAAQRRRVVMVNLSLCFQELHPHDLRAICRKSFIQFGQSFLDRSWLWHGSRERVKARLKLTGDWSQALSQERLLVFAPHFYGLDAAGMAIMAHALRPLCSIYTQQSNPVVDAWMRAGRSRYENPVLLTRFDGPREIARQVRSGRLLYLLPDMDFGSTGAVFVPFFGVQAATITSLSRFARLSDARVVSVVARLTAQGYEAHCSAPWADFPSANAQQDAARMNSELEALIRPAPEQYYWVHKRFKTRPPGQPSPYAQ